MLAVFNNVMNNANDLTVIGTYMIIKMVRIALSYLSLSISANYMSQVYVEKVFINEENPPQLTYQMLFWVLVDTIFNILVIGLLAIMSRYKFVDNRVISMYMFDYVITTLLISLCSWSIANIMYSKKYFLYKDDGLRAIRAFKSIMVYLVMILGLVPAGYMTTATFGSSFNFVTVTDKKEPAISIPKPPAPRTEVPKPKAIGATPPPATKTTSPSTEST